MRISFTRGETVSLLFEFFDEQGNPESIVGRTFFFTIKRKPDDDPTDALAAFKADLVDPFLDGAHGKLQVDLTSDESGALSGRYAWELKELDTQGNMIVIESDVLEVAKAIGNRTEVPA